VFLPSLQGHLGVIEAALHADSSEASVAIHSEVKRAISDSREALVQAAKGTSTVAFWLFAALGVFVIFAAALGLWNSF
jgi:hypothetical protein